MTRSLALIASTLTVVLIVAGSSLAFRYGSHSHLTLAAGTAPTVAASTAQVVGHRPSMPVRHRGSHLRREPSLNWDALAACESSGHWDDNTGNGYYGGTQMDLDFWRTYGGLRYATRPDLATRAQQIRVALNGWRVRGSQPWPACGWHFGDAR